MQQAESLGTDNAFSMIVILTLRKFLPERVTISSCVKPFVAKS